VWIDAEMAAIEAANRDRPKELRLNGALELILTPEEESGMPPPSKMMSPSTRKRRGAMPSYWPSKA
jgi:hypothetical protein